VKKTITCKRRKGIPFPLDMCRHNIGCKALVGSHHADIYNYKIGKSGLVETA
jgi:hypothetical protein